MQNRKEKIKLSQEIKATEKWQEILRTGDFSKGRAGVKFTKQDLSKVVENFKSNIIDSGMTTPEGFSELPVNEDHLMGAATRDALGWITDLKVEDNKRKGQSLFAKIRFTKLGKEKIENELLRGFSVEIHTKDLPFLNSETGDKTPFVLTGLALTNEPFISGMKAAELSANVKEKHIIKHFTKKMDTIKIMLSSLSDADKVTRGELELLNKVVTTLSDEEKKEVKEEVAAVETKVDEAEAKTADEAKAELAKKTEAEKLARDKMDMSKRVEELETKLSTAQSELDKTKLSMREKDTQKVVKELFNSGKIVGEKIVDKTTQMLLSKSEKDATELIEFFSSQPAKIEKGEVGYGESEKIESVEALKEKANTIKLAGDTRSVAQILTELIGQESTI